MKKILHLINSALLACSFPLQAEPHPSRQWLTRPWEIRYIIFVADIESREMETRIGIRLNNEKAERVYLDGEALFNSYTRFAISKELAVTSVLISFDRDGGAHSANLPAGQWVAKRSELNSLVLIDATHPQLPPYHIAEFDQGIAGEMTFSPAVCDDLDGSRYSETWDPITKDGDFGCREWTAQLYDRDRPYIDITTYSQYGHYIGSLVGWSRFTDPPKPVIGKQGNTWLCLHECPAGERPGIIPDIRKWTAKHGFPMPQRPRKQPEYPNSDFKDSWQE